MSATNNVTTVDIQDSRLVDVWTNVIGAQLRPRDIVALSMTCKWGQIIAAHIVSPSGLALARGVEALAHALVTWPHFSFHLRIETQHDHHQQQQHQQHQQEQAQQHRDAIISQVLCGKGCRLGGLTLSRCDMTDFDVDLMRNNTTIQELAITYPRPRPPRDQLARLGSAVSTCTAITCLTLNGCVNPVDDITWLGVLQHMPQLTNLDLQGNFLRPHHADSLRAGLSHVTQLTALDLGANEIGRSIDTVAPSIQKMPYLKYLSLRGNLIPESPALATALEHLCHLTDLRLQGNSLYSSGLVMLLPVLANLHHLTALNISTNCINSTPPSSFWPHVAQMTQLRKLNMSHNPIFFYQFAELVDTVEKLPALRWLDITGHDIECEPETCARVAHITDLRWTMTIITPQERERRQQQQKDSKRASQAPFEWGRCEPTMEAREKRRRRKFV